MSTDAPAGPGKNVAATVIGLLTLLFGGAYAVAGGQLVWAGASWAEQAGDDPWGPVVTFFGLLPAIVIAVGVAFLLLGLVGLLAGVGVLLRKQWGRVLTFSLAALAVLLGVVWASGGEQGATEVALGMAQVLYGILAVVILIKNGAEFSTRRAERTATRGREVVAEPARPLGF